MFNKILVSIDGSESDSKILESTISRDLCSNGTKSRNKH